ncbi:MAG: DEAD/DEAH box helicase [Deltaproteobacteria bacterium]|nr:DEAD/DEAH box helicase [Deltaproteobacteria bacterium]
MWQDDAAFWRNIVVHERLPAIESAYAPFPEMLAARLRDALINRGITQLYVHQYRAFSLASEGRDIIVSTPTASGKSLCYNLPVLNVLAEDPKAKAVYLFPTKALSRDQEAALRGLMRDAGLSHAAITYDGDTPADARRAAREQSGVVMTNPDMLHTGILPHHTNWARLFSNLRYVVVDEIHSYRGVFGSHLANVIRRLLRIARFHGSDPVFLFASATVGNPDGHASRMLGRPVTLVDQNGAPAGPRRWLIYNPPVVNAELGIRASYIKSAVRLTGDLVRAGVTTLVFGQSRNNVEVMLKYLRDRLARDAVDPETIHAYRGGYLPETRRRIEKELREGSIRCVVATNALELGIDIGSLDAVVCAGYPGTISGLWQRFGRGGRRGGESLAILVSSSAPLDQYVARERRYLLGAPVEEARIDPDNIEILMQHLKCAAFELKFEKGDVFGDIPPDLLSEALEHLVAKKLVHPETGSAGRRLYHWVADVYPANGVSLRSVGEDNFVIIDREHDQAIGEMDFRAAHTMLHEQAIYQQGGEQYQVETLDFDNRKAFVRRVIPDYFTDAMTYTSVSVIEEEEQIEFESGLLACRGEVSVVEKVVGYKKIKFHSHENVGYGDVELPEMHMETTAFWLTVPERVVRLQRVERPAVIDALIGLAHALHTVAAVGLMTDPRDLGYVLGNRTDPDAPPSKGRVDAMLAQGPGFDPTIFLFDRVAGGIGLAPRLFEEREELLRRTYELLQGCDCKEGCPACVGPLAREAADLDPPFSRKAVALEILASLGTSATH